LKSLILFLFIFTYYIIYPSYISADINDEFLNEDIDLESFYSQIPENFDIDLADKEEFEKLPFFSNTDADRIIDIREKLYKNNLSKNIDEINWLNEIQKEILKYLSKNKGKIEKPLKTKIKSGYTNNPDKESFDESKYYFKGLINSQKHTVSIITERDAKEPESFDLYSGSISFSMEKGKTRLTLGDYRTNIGQGLTISRFKTFYGNSVFTDNWKESKTENTSFDESCYLRGGYLSRNYRKTKLTMLYSQRKQNALSENGEIVSIDDTGYDFHSDTRKYVKENIISGGIEINKIKGFDIGFAGLLIKYTPGFTAREGERYNYQPAGKEFRYLIFDGRYVFNNAKLFFEQVNMNGNESAVISGIELNQEKFKMGLLIRKYSPGYWCLRSAGVSSFDETGNEEGILLGFSTYLPYKTKMSLITDIANTITRTYNANMPDSRTKISLSIDRNIFKNTKSGFTYRKSEEDILGDKRESYKLYLEDKYNKSKQSWGLSSVWSKNNNGGGPFGEIHYAVSNGLLKGSLFAFDIPSYDSRYYHYEFNVPGFGSSKAVWGKGYGYIFLLKAWDFSFRYRFSDSDSSDKTRQITLQYDKIL